MAYNSLGNYYQLSFNFIFVNKFCDMNTYENMYPFELQLYSTMLKNHISLMNTLFITMATQFLMLHYLKQWHFQELRQKIKFINTQDFILLN